MNENFFRISSEIQSALAANQPVVALESTVIAHGLPRPQNRETARQLERIVREAGATPATIAVLEGRLSVGLDQNQIELIGNGENVKKISTRDLAVWGSCGWNGALPVAWTL